MKRDIFIYSIWKNCFLVGFYGRNFGVWLLWLWLRSYLWFIVLVYFGGCFWVFEVCFHDNIIVMLSYYFSLGKDSFWILISRSYFGSLCHHLCFGALIFFFNSDWSLIIVVTADIHFIYYLGECFNHRDESIILISSLLLFWRIFLELPSLPCLWKLS